MLPYFMVFKFLLLLFLLWRYQQRNRKMKDLIHKIQYLDQLFEHNGIATLVVDTEGKILRFNKRFLELTGFKSTNTLLEQNWQNILSTQNNQINTSLSSHSNIKETDLEFRCTILPLGSLHNKGFRGQIRAMENYGQYIISLFPD